MRNSSKGFLFESVGERRFERIPPTVNQGLRRKSSAECENMVMISIGKPFDMASLFKNRAILLWASVATIMLWISWEFWIGVFDFLTQLWAWRPATVIGLAMIFAPIILAYPTQYFLNVRRTSEAGVILVSGFSDYAQHKLLKLLVLVAFNGSILSGVVILLFGFDLISS